MKKLLLTLTTIGLFSTPAFAGSPYVSLSTGLSLIGESDVTVLGDTTPSSMTFKSGVPFVGAVGIKNDGYRVELSLGYQFNYVDEYIENGVRTPSITDARLSVFSYLVNGYYDIDMKGGVTPYLTAGIGGATLTGKTSGTPDASKSGFAYQLGAGIGVKASESVVIDFGYRYFKPSNYSENVGGKIYDQSYLIHNFLAGVRYTF
ncbi:MAG: outer membrane beta-barrel protein [Chlorobiaceae bacterium]